MGPELLRTGAKCPHHSGGSSLPGVVCSHTSEKERGLVSLTTHLVQPPHVTDEEPESQGRERFFPRPYMEIEAEPGWHWDSFNLNEARKLVPISKVQIRDLLCSSNEYRQKFPTLETSWNTISLSNRDPVSTSVHSPQPPLHGFDKEHTHPSKFSTDWNHWKASWVGREGENWGRDIVTLFLPNPLGIPRFHRQIYTNTIHIFSKTKRNNSLDFHRSYFRFLKEPFFRFIDICTFLFKCKFE